MVFLKLLLALPRLALAVFKLALKLLLVFAVLGFILGIKAAMGIMVVVTGLLLLIFITNLFSVLTENAQYNQASNKKGRYKSDDYYWTPGQAAVSYEAISRGFHENIDRD